MLDVKFGEIAFHIAMRKGFSISKNITVKSNDPKNPVIKLVIKGKIKVEINVMPETIFFGQIIWVTMQIIVQRNQT